MKGSLSLRGFRKLRTGAIVATGVFLIGLASVQTTVQASEEDGVWVARTVEQVKADIQKEDNFFKYEIKWGDTLSVISEATNIPVDVLKEMNRISDRNLFLPHNELLYTEGESVTDSKTKHKIIIKESYGKKEVRTYEVVLQKNNETAEVSFELKETTEKVQTSDTSVVCYGEVYNLVSDQVEGVTETPTPAQPAEEQPAAPGVTETPTPAQPAEEQPAAPGATETPAQPTETTPAGSGTTETPAPTKPAEEHPAAPGATETPAPAQPVEENPAAPGATETPTPAQPAEEHPVAPGAIETPAPTKPAEEQPTAPGVTETPAPAQPAEENPAAPGATETPAPAQPAETTPAGSGATEQPTPAQPTEGTPVGSGATEKPTPAQPTEGTPVGSGATEQPTPAQPAEGTPAGSGTTEQPTPAQPTETTPAGSEATETPTPAQPAETTPAGSGATEQPTPVQPTEGTPVGSGATEQPTPAQPAEGTPAGSGTTENPAPVKPAETTPAGSGATEQPTPAQPAETTPAGSGATETPAPAQPAEGTPADSGATETPAPAQPAETTPADSGATETPAPAQPAEEHPASPGATETPAPTKPAEEQPTAPGTTETPAPAQPAEEHPTAPGTTETPAPAQPAEGTPAGSGATETPAPAQPAEGTPAGSGATETPTPAQPAETIPAGSGTTENLAPAQPAEEKPATSGTTETPAPAQPAETTPAGSGATETPTPAGSNNQNNPTEPKDDVEKGLEENNSELESRKNIKLEEIESSSLPSSEKEAAKLKVEEYTNKAKEAMKQAKTTDDQAAVVDNYSDDLATINTPGVDQGKPDYTNSGLSGNGPEGTHIGDNNAIGHGNSTPENTGFRNAPVYQPRVTRRARSVDEPMDKVAIYYNYTEMKDIAGFLGDPGESVVTVPKGATHEQVQAIVKSKIDEKKAELAKKGYTFLEDYFVDKPQEDTIRYDYIVNFTKPSSLRMAPMIQPRSSRTRRSVEEPKVKTRTITLYYQLAELEIAGSLGNPGQNYVITVPETATAEEIQQAIDQQTSREKASLSRYFQYVGETNLQNDILNRGFGNFDYVITFARRK